MKANIKAVSIGTIYLTFNTFGHSFYDRVKKEEENIGKYYKMRLGGSSFNVARNLSKLGISTTFIGMLGNDLPGKIIFSLLKREKVLASIIVSDNAQTNVAFNIINSEADKIMFASGDSNESLIYENIINKCKQIAGINCIYFGGLSKLKSLSKHDIAKLINYFHKNKMRIFLDHGRIYRYTDQNIKQNIKHALKLLNCIDFYLPSEKELLNLWGENDIEKCLKRIYKITESQIVVKLGRKGAAFIEKGEMKIIKSIKVNKPFLTAGAGDLFNSAFIAYVLKKNNVVSAIRFANKYAGSLIGQ